MSDNLKPFKKGEGGRKKGTPNKFTTLKADFLKAYDDIGGVEELANWASKNAKNQSQFYKILASMLPRHVDISSEDHARALAEKIREHSPELYEKMCEIMEGE